MKSKNLKRVLKADLIEYIEVLEQQLEQERKAREDDKVIYESVLEEYSKIADDLNKEILRLQTKCESYESSIASYRARVNNPVLVEGNEKDLYEGEQRDHVVAILKRSLPDIPERTRRHDVIKSIIDANPEKRTKDDLINEIAKILKSNVNMTTNVRAGLEKAGFVFRDASGTCTSHYTAYFKGDKRYKITLFATPSDCRNTMNVISDIKAVCF